MKKVLIFVSLFLLSSIGVEASERKPYEMPRTQVIPIQDSGSGRQYELYVRLPEGYLEEEDAEHPVIYFTDAVWHIELLSASTEYLMEDAILVGISWEKDAKEDWKKGVAEDVSRFQDYTVRKSSNPEIQAKYQMGQASNHLNFIRNDVIKTVEKSYRTDPDRRTYFSYSLGGLFGAYILMTQPDTFSNYILGSPALERDMPYFSELASSEAIKRKDLNANVFISHGSLEKELAELIKEFITLLENRNDENLSLKYVVIEGNHQTAFPMTGVRSVTWLSGLKSE
jgi:predicted alpha/beta superfamily hydrolase